MQSSFRPHIRFRWPCLFCLGLWLVALIGAPGCSKEKQKSAPSVSKPPTMHLIYPQQKRISHIVGQPSFVQSYERTSIFPKVTAFIQKWNVDIGDKVQKGDVLADLFVPELRENWETKKAEVQLEKERVALALKMVTVGGRMAPRRGPANP
jgi:multidrug efflux pump subunit AcrA (membrane-fusion protein)